MTYEIELRPAAVRALKRIDHQDRSRIRGAIALLAADPRPPGGAGPGGRGGRRRRGGCYRIVYPGQDERLLIVVVTRGHRRDVYDR